MSGAEVQIVRSRSMAQHVHRCVSSLTHVAGIADLEAAKQRMLLAFSQTAAPEKLRECSGESVAFCIALSAISGLMPGGPKPDVWIIPRRRKGVWEANWQMSFRGYVRLASMAGHGIEVRLVHEGDDFQPDYRDPLPFHRPAFAEEPTYENLVCGYIVVEDPQGRKRWEILRKAEIEKRRKCAQTQEIWDKWPLEMVRKTVAAWGGAREMWPLSEAARYAIHADGLAQVDRQGELAEETARTATKLMESGLVITSPAPAEAAADGVLSAEEEAELAAAVAAEGGRND